MKTSLTRRWEARRVNSQPVGPRQRKTGAQREHEGIQWGIVGVILIVFGGLSGGWIGGLGVIFLVIGLAMWVAGMARSD